MRTKLPAEFLGCSAIEGVPPSDLLFFGEMHGSNEMPALVFRQVCAAARKGPVALGLEIPEAEEGRIEKFLASQGSESDRAALLDSPFWASMRDGRSSLAMARLIDDVRRLRQAGLDVRIFPFDKSGEASRDQLLADGIRQFRRDHQGLPIIALMGNIHASKENVVLDERSIVTSGKILEDLKPTSILITYGKGTTWACMGNGCKVQSLNNSWAKGRAPGFHREVPMGSHDGSYLLPEITASLPAATSSEDRK